MGGYVESGAIGRDEAAGRGAEEEQGEEAVSPPPNVKDFIGTVLALAICLIVVGMLFVALCGAADALVQASHDLLEFP